MTLLEKYKSWSKTPSSKEGPKLTALVASKKLFELLRTYPIERVFTGVIKCIQDK